MKEGMEMQAALHAGTGALNFTDRFANAKTHILLHAAIYNRFVNNVQLVEAMHTALAKEEVTLQVVLLPVWKDIPWMDAACTLLRPDDSRTEVLRKAEVSREFFLELREKYPAQVRLVEASRFPVMPLVIIDETIFCGHYAHSQVLAPDGYWMQLEAPVTSLLALLQEEETAIRQAGNKEHMTTKAHDKRIERQAERLAVMSPRELAALRFVEEWYTAASTGLSL